MTRAVQDVADEAWATSDNPRGETIETIFNDMRAA
jgi:UDP-N-acetylmuramyl tripeptide synthase